MLSGGKRPREKGRLTEEEAREDGRPTGQNDGAKETKTDDWSTVEEKVR